MDQINGILGRPVVTIAGQTVTVAVLIIVVLAGLLIWRAK